MGPVVDSVCADDDDRSFAAWTSTTSPTPPPILFFDVFVVEDDVKLMNAMPNLPPPLRTFDPLVLSDVVAAAPFFVDTACRGVDRSSSRREFSSVRLPSPPPPPEDPAPPPPLGPAPSTGVRASLLRFLVFVVRAAANPSPLSPLPLTPPSNDEAEESSSSTPPDPEGGRVRRSNISGGRTAPRDKIRLPLVVLDPPPPLFLFVAGTTTSSDFLGDADADADAIEGVIDGADGAGAASSSDDDDDDDDEPSLPYPFNKSMEN